MMNHITLYKQYTVRESEIAHKSTKNKKVSMFVKYIWLLV